MAGKSAVLAIRVIADTQAARKGLDQTGDSVQGVGKKASKFAVPAAAVVGGLALMAKSALDSASVLQQSTGAVQSVFGKYARDVSKQAKTAATGVGLSISSYQNMAVVLGAQLKNTGTPMDQVSGKTSDLIKKGADLAAMFGGTTSDAVEAISSLMRGERDPIERYGVSISQAAIDAFEASKGLTHLTGAAKKQADGQATLALLTKQTASATGQFARETNTAAGATEISNAKFENAKALMGTKLLPVIAKVKGVMGDLFGLISSHITTVQILAGVIGVLSAAVLAVGIYTKVAAAVTKIWAAAQAVFNAIMDANPIVLVVLALAALVAGLVLAYQHSQTFRAIIQAAFHVVVVAAQAVANFFVHDIPAAFSAVVAFLRKWMPLVLAVIAPFIGLPLLIWQHFSAIKGFIGNAFSAAYNTARTWIGNLVSAVTGIPGRIAGTAGRMLSAGAHLVGSLFSGIRDGISHAGGAIADVVGSFVRGIASAINNLLNLPWVIKLDIHGPGPLPDLHFGPYTLLPRIPLSAAAMLPEGVPGLPGGPSIADLAPGWTLMAAATNNPFSWAAAFGAASAGAMAGATTVHVHFDGLVTDPDGTARAIEDLLAGRRRRVTNGRG